MSIVFSILGIVVCGVLGGMTAWAIVAALGLGGTMGAIVAAIIGMFAAFALWAAGSSLLRAVGWIR